MNSKVKVSIIVPVYNGPEKALRNCIESAIRQTMKEIEIILVDDGSSDGSGAICDEYAAEDNRIKVIHKKNGGLSAARNRGYEAAIGKWITFVDSDDWIEATTCQETYSVGEEQGVDIVLFGTIQEFENYKNPFKYHFHNGEKFVGDDCRKLQTEILDFTGNIATAWAKLIRKSVLEENEIEHNAELRQGSEGIEFNIRLFEHIKSAYFTDKVYYHYVYNPNSISAKHNEKNHLYVIRCFEKIREEIDNSDNGIALQSRFYNRFAYVLVSAAISGYFSPNNKLSYKEKKDSFSRYMSLDLPANTICKYDPKCVDTKRRIVLRLIRMKFYLPILVLSTIRHIQKH